MPSDLLTLPIPETFPSFPYSPPYSIQVDLMKHVYDAIERRKVAIIESPTGTGKTLSLLCSTLTWLADDKERRKRGLLKVLKDSLQGDNEPEWVLEQTLQRHKRELETEEIELEQRLEKARRKEEAFRRMTKALVHKKQKLSSAQPEVEDEDASFLPEDETGEDDENGLSPIVKALMKSLADSRTKDKTVQETKEPSCTKIYYASRTHSQLAQLRSELLKTTHSTARVVPLASRRNLCINEELRAKGDNVTNLDEGCRELLNEKKGKRCPYMPSPDEQHKMLDFRDYVLATPKDIEDLVTIGKELRTCPYFGSRRAIPQAELVTLPYNLLLQKSAREALGIDLNNQVVIIDEAHNLIDTVLAIHTVTLSSHILNTSIHQLTVYFNRFQKRLNPTHELHLRRLLRFLNALKLYMDQWKLGADTGQAPAKQEIMAASSLISLLGAQVDGVNLLEIEAYLRRSKIARKVSGYSEKVLETTHGQGLTILANSTLDSPQVTRPRRYATPPLHAVETFILALTNEDSDGRLTLSLAGDLGNENVLLKYQLLNPSNKFKEVVDVARCVLLAGGTMSPVEDFLIQLFPFLSEQQLSIFSCGHVIPSANLQTLVIGRGPLGGELKFKYDRRSNQDTMIELGQILANLVNLVPHGIVVFFPSYSFLNTVKAAFQRSGLLEKLNLKKKLFFEPTNTSEVDNVLRQYALAISSLNPNPNSKKGKGGALLFAVVGAKLSEGINFSDSLARAIIIVGLPFPSLASIELKERMRYVTDLAKTMNIGRSAGAKDAGMELYENLCMKSVNQSIGRAIRHQNDFASLILLDTRYASPGISAKLPKWIRQDIIVTKNFGHAVKEVGQFFRFKM